MPGIVLDSALYGHSTQNHSSRTMNHPSNLKLTVAGCVLALLPAACTNTGPGMLSATERADFLALGDSISAQAQQVLLKNVSAAMQAGGPEHAVAFCNTRAVPLTDSVAALFEVDVQRLSDRNRDPDNGIRLPQDRAAWERFASDKSAFVQQDAEGAVWYYKPITVGMPTCLKCHGGAEDIAEGTRAVLAEMYPQDRATGYQLGDLRGMWKIGLRPKP